ncbi:hypothetical protein Acr_15g0006260 [Actinidia rufa]|uniref:RING/U-box superfamily protein n=1 Tax=Actinidia rufa TaxID=165716 RepID=A0A7J0FUA5_9ERIC|nr:hypothetical protein Acr_15g0006260 [Actinidia rufa]
MNTRGLRGPSQTGSVRNTRRRKMALDVDLNVPPSENLDQEGPSAHSNPRGVQAGQQGGSAPPAPIDVDAFDDDVVICSPRAFAEVAAMATPLRQCAPTLTSVDATDWTSARQHRMCPMIFGTKDKRKEGKRISEWKGEDERRGDICSPIQYPCINFVTSNGMERENVQSVEPSPPKEPTFKCPVCMGQLAEEMSTKCGHIFSLHLPQLVPNREEPVVLESMEWTDEYVSSTFFACKSEGL